MLHPLCKNCRHFVNDHTMPLSMRYGKCRLNVERVPERIDPIDGRLVPASNMPKYASITRKHGDCGEDGRLFEPETSERKRFLNEHGGTALYGASVIGLMLIAATAVGVAKSVGRP